MKELAYLISGEVILIILAFLLYRNIRETKDDSEGETFQAEPHLNKKWKYFIGSIVLSAVLLIVIIKFMINLL